MTVLPAMLTCLISFSQMPAFSQMPRMSGLMVSAITHCCRVRRFSFDSSAKAILEMTLSP